MNLLVVDRLGSRSVHRLPELVLVPAYYWKTKTKHRQTKIAIIARGIRDTDGHVLEVEYNMGGISLLCSSTVAVVWRLAGAPRGRGRSPLVARSFRV